MCGVEGSDARELSQVFVGGLVVTFYGDCPKCDLNRVIGSCVLHANLTPTEPTVIRPFLNREFCSI